MAILNDNLRDIFNTHGEPKAKQMHPPLFITGCMRSGTTYLANKLASHPQLLKIGAELNQVWTDIGGADIKGNCPHLTEAHATAAYTYQLTNYFNDFIHESKSPKRHLMRWVKNRDTNLFRVKYDWDNLIPMNKSPHLINKLRFVHALFPESKFIFLIRDIYGQSASLKYHFLKTKATGYVLPNELNCWHIDENKGFTPRPGESSFPNDFSLIPEMWMRLNHIGLREIESIGQDKFLVIKYEDLVEYQSFVFEDIFKFIGTDSMHKQVENDIKVIEAKKKNTSTEGDSMEKWKKQLTTAEIQSIENAITSKSQIYDEIQGLVDRYSVSYNPTLKNTPAT